MECWRSIVLSCWILRCYFLSLLPSIQWSNFTIKGTGMIDVWLDTSLFSCSHLKTVVLKGRVLFYSNLNRPFSLPWWSWLSSIGVMLSCSVAVKFVGIFVVIFVGCRTIADLWEILGDLSRPVVFSLFCIDAYISIHFLIFRVKTELYREAFHGTRHLPDCNADIVVHGHLLYPFGRFK